MEERRDYTRVPVEQTALVSTLNTNTQRSSAECFHPFEGLIAATYGRGAFVFVTPTPRRRSARH
jgi:hypothetical protein